MRCFIELVDVAECSILPVKEGDRRISKRLYEKYLRREKRWIEVQDEVDNHRGTGGDGG